MRRKNHAAEASLSVDSDSPCQPNAPERLTRAADFRTLGPEREALYQVRSGIPRESALAEAECLMTYARQRVSRAIYEPLTGDEAYALCLVLDAVAGLYDAAEAAT